ncbi:MAG: HPP family protein [Dehalococcoidia bacterium]
MKIIDPRFLRYSRYYFLQAFLAAGTMLVILIFVDSLADAALVAALGGSVLIVFVHPNSHAAKPRSLVGGHFLAMLIGSLTALVLFAMPVQASLGNARVLFDLGLAGSLGLLILVMAITDTEHPPAAGTVLGVASQPLDFKTVVIIISAVLLLFALQWFLKPYLQDLT